MAEYEALIMGLQLVRKLVSKRVSIMGDPKLIIKQISVEYSINNPRLDRYRDTILDLIKDLLESNFAAIPRKQTCRPTLYPPFLVLVNFLLNQITNTLQKSDIGLLYQIT